jgi:anti-anti-sigma factor
MEMSAWRENDKLIVKLTGEIDHHSIKDIREEIDSIIIDSKPQSLILDLGEIDFMDSSGLGLVLGRLRRMNEICGKLFILNPTPRIEQILQMAGVDKLIPIIKNERNVNGR